MRRLARIMKPLSGSEETEGLEEGVNLASSGLDSLAGLVQGGDPEACELAAYLRIARGGCALRLSDTDRCARDLLAAIELAPGALAPAWKEVVSQAFALVKLEPTWGVPFRPSPGDPLPGPAFLQVGRDVIFALAGEKVD